MRKKNATLHDLIWMLGDYPYIRQAKSHRELCDINQFINSRTS
jgi:hypothetical protein